MSKINYSKLHDESKKYGVSIHTLIKRELKYKKVSYYRKGIEGCELCLHSHIVKYVDCSRFQCVFILEMNAAESEVKKGYSCRFFRRSVNK